jgi:hypothetical protein
MSAKYPIPQCVVCGLPIYSYRQAVPKYCRKCRYIRHIKQIVEAQR